MKTFLLFLCILLSIQSIRTIIKERELEGNDWVQWVFYIPTAIIWSIYFTLY
jgi:hypothetical protein